MIINIPMSSCHHGGMSGMMHSNKKDIDKRINGGRTKK